MSNKPICLALVALGLTPLSLVGCDDDGAEGNTTTSSSSTSGGAGGATSSGGGAGGTSSGGGATSSGGGEPPFWDEPFVPDQLPDPATGNHNAGMDCMTCHSSGLHVRLFAGTIYQSDGTTPAPSVEVGVRDGDTLRTAYSAQNGNFWFSDDGGTINWPTAQIRARNANGEVIMLTPGAAGCNACHNNTLPITEP